MQSKFHQKIELLANVAIIVVAALLGYFLIKNFFFQPNTPTKQSLEIVKGTKIPLSDIDWQTNQKTLLLVLQKDCKFCTESMSFYKTLVEKSKEKNTKLIAILPNSSEESVQYLKENGVEIQEIKQSQLNEINVRGTPTLILLNEKGEVLNSWIGKLPAQKEKEVAESF
jgi:thioredoxin-related protein